MNRQILLMIAAATVAGATLALALTVPSQSNVAMKSCEDQTPWEWQAGQPCDKTPKAEWRPHVITTAERAKLEALSKRSILDGANDPQSVTFNSIKVVAHETKGTAIAVCIKARGRNGFGAIVRQRFLFDLVESRYVTIDDGDPTIEGHFWRKHCE